MNFKKLCAGLMSGIMAVGMFTGTCSFKNQPKLMEILPRQCWRVFSKC